MGAGAVAGLAKLDANATSEELWGVFEGLSAQERQRLTAAMLHGRKLERSRAVALLLSDQGIKSSMADDELNILIQAFPGEADAGGNINLGALVDWILQMRPASTALPPRPSTGAAAVGHETAVAANAPVVNDVAMPAPTAAAAAEPNFIHYKAEPISEEHDAKPSAHVSVANDTASCSLTAAAVTVSEPTPEDNEAAVAAAASSEPNSEEDVSSAAGILNGDVCRLERVASCGRLDASERSLGLEHPSTLTALDNLASSLNALGRPVVGNLATTLYALGRPVEAEPLEGRRLEASERSLEAEPPSTLTALGSLASSLNALGRPIVGNMASTLSAWGRPVEAAPLEGRRLEASEQSIGPEHPSTLSLEPHSQGRAARTHMLRPRGIW